jgi:6-pyruvoyltetrahydropterin/6-carboxytetrahydropterin synthase
MTSLTRRYPFSASHRLHTERLGPEENRRVFGKCNNPYGHGHNYFLEVTMAGETHAPTGLLAPVSRLDAHVRQAVLARLDHANLNELPEFAERVPTTENLGLQIGRWLDQDWAQVGPVRLARLRLEETGSNAVEIEFHGS